MAKKKGVPSVRDRENTPLMFLMLLLTLCFGGYYQWTVLLAGAALCLLLVLTLRKADGLTLPTGAAFWLLCALPLLSLLCLPVAVSGGMAFSGTLRWVVALLFFLYTATYTDGERASILDSMGYVGAVMALCSLVYFLWQTVTGAENANGRIDGFFQYANTYALFLTACLVLLLLKEKRHVLDWFAMGVLLCTIFLSGSRGVFLLAGGAALFLGVYFAVKRRRVLPLVIGLAVIVAAGALATVLSGGLVLRRLAAITLQSSSLNGRLLYYLDGIKMALEHPLGIGRGGYLYLQPIYQTGVYTLQTIHNEYLQTALDGGLLSGLALLALPVCLFLRRGLGLRERLVIALLALHACIDFDFQFSAVFFLLLLCGSGGRVRVVKRPGKVAGTVGAVLGAVLLYFTLPYGLDFLGHPAAAYRLWPADLALAEERLQHCADMEEAVAVADAILADTDLSMLSLDCKFVAAAEQADYPEMVRHKYQYLRLNRYRPQVYEEFVTLLENAIVQQEGTTHLEEYKTLAAETGKIITEVCTQTSPLAYRIVDKPDLSFAPAMLIRLQSFEER